MNHRTSNDDDEPWPTNLTTLNAQGTLHTSAGYMYYVIQYVIRKCGLHLAAVGVSILTARLQWTYNCGPLEIGKLVSV